LKPQKELRPLSRVAWPHSTPAPLVNWSDKLQSKHEPDL